MSIITREQIMNTLLALLRSRCGDTFLTYSRRLVMWQDLASKNPILRQPALFLYDGLGLGGGVDNWRGSYGTPRVRTMRRTIVIYAQLSGIGSPGGTSDTTSPGGRLFHPLIESVEAAMAPDDTYQNTLTLGGIVQHCWLDGDGHMSPPDIDPNGQGMQTLQVGIMLP